MFLAHFTNSSFDYLLELDMLTFNDLLDAAVRVDASRWTQIAWTLRAAHHAEQGAFEQMVKKSWGHAQPEAEKPKAGINELIARFGGGF